MATQPIDLNAALALLQYYASTGEYVRMGHYHTNGKGGGSAAIAFSATEAMDYCRNASAIADHFELQVEFTVTPLGSSLAELELPRHNSPRALRQNSVLQSTI